MTGEPPVVDRGPDNCQDRAAFEAEAESIAALSRPIAWIRPSKQDADRRDLDDAVDDELAPTSAGEIVGAGRVRGLLLHKLLEEMLWEGLPEDQDAVAKRAEALLPEVEDLDIAAAPDCVEVAQTALATLQLPEVAEVRSALVPEVPVFGLLAGDNAERPMAGRADAIAIEGGKVTLVVDWKSDVAPGENVRQAHVEQLRTYLAAMDAPRGALVYASLGFVHWVDLPVGWRPS
jgi:CRISPR-associated exonuclease Cas4